MKEKEEKFKFSSYKKEVFDFNRSDSSYEQRVGKPDELSSVIGLILIGFQRLEDMLSAFIIEMLDVDIPMGKIVVSELSFTNKVNLFSSLFHLLKNERHFNYGSFDKDEYLKELVKAILKCQVFRNQVVHSSFLKNFKTQSKIVKHKMTSKSKRGLVELHSEVDIPLLFDIYDYLISISVEVEEFFIDFNPDRKVGNNKYIGTELSDIFKYRV